MCKERKMLDLLPTTFCFSGLLCRPRRPASRPQCHWIIHFLCVSLSNSFSSLSLSLGSEQVVIRSEPTPIPLSNPFPLPSVFSAKWGPCNLPQVHPLHCSPSRLLLKVLSFNHFFKKRFFFSGQYEVTDHIRAAFRLSDHLIKPRSISLPLLSDHLFFLGLRGEARGLGPLNPIPTKALEVDRVTYTNSQGFRA